MADPFSIDLTLRHETYDPAKISKALSIQPKWSFMGGEGRRRASSWRAAIAEGSDVASYSERLKDVASLLTSKRDFLCEFTSAGGGILVTINHHVQISTATDFKADKGDSRQFKSFEVSLYPELLGLLAGMGIELRICAWA